MGKKGAAMRAAKALKATQRNSLITMTPEQLAAHDKLVRESFREEVWNDCCRRLDEKAREEEAALNQELEQKSQAKQEEIDKFLCAEWKAREALFKVDDSGINPFVSLLLCAASRVLIEKFHWKPIPQDGCFDRRNHTVRFADYLVDEINAFSCDQEKDLRDYCKETYMKYGVKYRYLDGDGNEEERL